MTWALLTDQAGGWAHWSNLDAAQQWMQQAADLTTAQREAELDAQGFDAQYRATADAWGALVRAWAALNLVPISSPTFQCWFVKWGIMFKDPRRGFGTGPEVVTGMDAGFTGNVWRARIHQVLARAKPHATGEVGEVWVPMSINAWGSENPGNATWANSLSRLWWQQCQGTAAGQGDCDFYPRFGNWNGCTNAANPQPDRNDCDPWTWNTLAWHAPPDRGLYGSAPEFRQVLVPIRWCFQAARELAAAMLAMGGANLIGEARAYVIFNNLIGADNYGTDPFQFAASNVGAFQTALQAGAPPIRQATAVVRAMAGLANVVPGWGQLASALLGVVSVGLDALQFVLAATWNESEFGEVLQEPPSDATYTGRRRTPMAYRRAELVRRDGNAAPYFDARGGQVPEAAPALGAVDRSTVTGDQAYLRGLAAALYGPCVAMDRLPSNTGAPWTPWPAPRRGGDVAEILAVQGPAALVSIATGVPLPSGRPAPASTAPSPLLAAFMSTPVASFITPTVERPQLPDAARALLTTAIRPAVLLSEHAPPTNIPPGPTSIPPGPPAIGGASGSPAAPAPGVQSSSVSSELLVAGAIVVVLGLLALGRK